MWAKSQNTWAKISTFLKYANEIIFHFYWVYTVSLVYPTTMFRQIMSVCRFSEVSG